MTKTTRANSPRPRGVVVAPGTGTASAGGTSCINPHAAALGRLGGSRNTPAQIAARLANIAKSAGRPRKRKLARVPLTIKAVSR